MKDNCIYETGVYNGTSMHSNWIPIPRACEALYIIVVKLFKA